MEDSHENFKTSMADTGFAPEYDPKIVRGESAGTHEYDPAGNLVDKSGYGTKERDWTTQGEFQLANQDAMDVFAELIDSPEEELEDKPEVYTDGGYVEDMMANVDHTGPFGGYKEGGAPW